MKLNLPFLGLLFLLTIAACTAPTSEQTEAVAKTISEKVMAAEPGFIHTVFFWMKEGVSQADRERFEQGMRKLAKVSSIQNVYWGPPAGTDREVVDNSYDYAWIVHFANAADQDAYQDDPIHLQFIEACKDLWEKVVVYDNLVKK